MEKKKGNALRQWRKDNGYTIREAAGTLRPKVSAPTWCRWEVNEKMPSQEHLKGIISLTEGKVTADDFCGLREVIDSIRA